MNCTYMGPSAYVTNTKLFFMVIIAESGATKTDWCSVSEKVRDILSRRLE